MSRRPRTLCGLMLRTIPLRSGSGVRDPIVDRMVDTGWVDVEPTTQLAMDRAIAQVFAPDADVRDIRRFVLELSTRYPVEAFPPREAEAIIRASLGETEAFIEDIDDDTAYGIMLLVFGAMIDVRGLSESELDTFLAETEDVAFERGLHPVLSAEG